jgi:hypothetical protein
MGNMLKKRRKDKETKRIASENLIKQKQATIEHERIATKIRIEQRQAIEKKVEQEKTKERIAYEIKMKPIREKLVLKEKHELLTMLMNEFQKHLFIEEQFVLKICGRPGARTSYLYNDVGIALKQIGILFSNLDFGYTHGDSNRIIWNDLLDEDKYDFYIEMSWELGPEFYKNYHPGPPDNDGCLEYEHAKKVTRDYLKAYSQQNDINNRNTPVLSGYKSLHKHTFKFPFRKNLPKCNLIKEMIRVVLDEGYELTDVRLLYSDDLCDEEDEDVEEEITYISLEWSNQKIINENFWI